MPKTSSIPIPRSSTEIQIQILVQDTNRDGGTLTFTAAAWCAFATKLKHVEPKHESMQDTRDILGDEETLADLRQSRQDFVVGPATPWTRSTPSLSNDGA
jgi:hypothetical protein